jgi:hypothetical protein
MYQRDFPRSEKDSNTQTHENPARYLNTDCDGITSLPALVSTSLSFAFIVIHLNPSTLKTVRDPRLYLTQYL